MRIPLAGGDEHDALTGARRFYGFRAGTIKRLKRKYNKRLRAFMKRFAREWVE